MAMTREKRKLACSVALGAVLSLESTAVCATYGVRKIAVFAGAHSVAALAAVAVGVFAVAAGLCFLLLSKADAVLGWAERVDWPRLSGGAFAGGFSGKKVAVVAAIVFVCWLPWIILQYPCSMNGDTYNQLYQFQTSSPTLYTTVGVTVQESFVDHHPVFSTLIFGCFLTLGDALGSQNMGLFVYSLCQCALTAFALSTSCCYLERLGVPKVFRVVSVLFVALFPPIPQWATCMVKDSLNAPFFVLFALMYAEVLRTKGASLRSKRFLAAFFVVAFLFIVTKKSSALVFGAAMVVLIIVEHRSWTRSLLTAAVPLALGAAIVPALLYPAIGNVAPGGKQESFGFAFQQVVTAINDGTELSDSERETVSRVLDIERACGRIDPGLVDPVKNCCVRDATTSDYLAFIPAYFSIGLRDPGAYTSAVLNVNGPLIMPSRSFIYYSGPEQEETWVARFEGADTKGELHLDFAKPAELDAIAKRVQSVVEGIYAWHSPLLFFFTLGFYGGWIPLICLAICLFYDKRCAVALVPMLLCCAFLVIGPASGDRYVLPLLYATPLMMGLLCCAYARARSAHLQVAATAALNDADDRER